MQYQLRIQDPTEPRHSPLLDELIRLTAIRPVVEGRFFFGFVTGSGLDALLSVPTIHDMFHTASVDFLVGLDAVTNEAALERLAQLAASNNRFRARVVKNTTAALVHPKLIILLYEGGGGASVVGSNNLSTGGLGGNVEAYSSLVWDQQEDVDLSDWDRFLERWSALLGDIDAEAYDQARRNEQRARYLTASSDALTASDTGTGAVVVSDGQVREVTPSGTGIDEPILIAQVPRAGRRWSQVHLTAPLLRSFFRINPGTQVDLHLREFGTNAVEVRPVVYPHSNRNVRVELNAARRAAREAGYPAEGRPLVLFRLESPLQQRYSYLLRMPDDEGYEELTQLVLTEYSGPQRQVARAVVSRSLVLNAWPTCPL